MSLNSINTNNNAAIALQSLNKTASELAKTTKAISTGYTVSDATDDGAAYAVAQRVRSDVGALTTVNSQLNYSKGLVTTTVSNLNDVSNTVTSLKSLLVNLSSGTVTGDERKQYTDQYNSLLKSVKTSIQDASYNGKTLVGDISGSNGGFSNVAVIRNETGSTYGVSTFSGSALYASLSVGSGTAPITATAAQAALAINGSTQGAFVNAQDRLGTALNTYGAASNYIDHQVTANSNKIDALNSGLGSLVDADLSKEAATLTALQTRQQLGTQALSIANQAPSSLLSLFR